MTTGRNRAGSHPRETLVKVILLLIAINDRVRNVFKNIEIGIWVG